MAVADSSVNQDLLVNSSWNYITIDDEEFIIKILVDGRCSDPFYIILLSDFARLWKEELYSSHMIARNTTLNPNIEAPVGRLLNHLSNVITTRPSGTSNIFSIKNRNENEVVIVSQSKLSTLPYKWEFYTKLQSQDMVADYLTFPLIAAVAELHRRQNQLVKIITQKDAQLETYKAEGMHISSGNRVEQVFDIKEFQKSMEESAGFDNVVGSSASTTFGCELQSLFIAIKSKQLKNRNLSNATKIKCEPNSLENEDVLQETEGQSNSNSSAFELARREQLEKKLAEEKLKKNDDKPTKRLKF
ncbi:Non-ous end-joining factor 1 [Chamberlinius hualienensis]